MPKVTRLLGRRASIQMEAFVPALDEKLALGLEHSRPTTNVHNDLFPSGFTIIFFAVKWVVPVSGQPSQFAWD